MSGPFSFRMRSGWKGNAQMNKFCLFLILISVCFCASTLDAKDIQENPKLDEKVKNQIIEALKPLDPERVILFGSYAWGNPDKDSEIDLYC